LAFSVACFPPSPLKLPDYFNSHLASKNNLSSLSLGLDIDFLYSTQYLKKQSGRKSRFFFDQSYNITTPSLCSVSTRERRDKKKSPHHKKRRCGLLQINLCLSYQRFNTHFINA